MAQSTYTFANAREMIEKLDALPVAKRRLVKRVTVLNPTLTVQMHAPEVARHPKDFTLDSTLSLLPSLQLETLTIDLRALEKTKHLDPSPSAYAPYWRMLHGLFKNSNGWRELHFWPSGGMLRAWEGGVTGMSDKEVGVYGGGGVDAAKIWDGMVKGREKEGPGAGVKVYKEVEFLVPRCAEAGMGIDKIYGCFAGKSGIPSDRSSTVSGGWFPRDSEGKNIDVTKEEVKDEETDEVRPSPGYEKDKKPSLGDEKPKEKKVDLEIEEKEGSPTKKVKIEPTGQLKKSGTSLKRKASASTAKPEPELLIVAKRGYSAQIESRLSPEPKSLMEAIRTITCTKPTNITWKKVLEAEENVEVRGNSKEARSLASVAEDRSASVEIMRVLSGLGRLGVKEE